MQKLSNNQRSIMEAEGRFLSEAKTVSARVSDEVYKEILLRVPEGERGDFIRDAIAEKLEKTPRAD
jgi:hypothetical protein